MPLFFFSQWDNTHLKKKGAGFQEGLLFQATVILWSVFTPSPKQPFSFLGRLAINSYLALCQQESDSVACGSAWLTVHSGG